MQAHNRHFSHVNQDWAVNFLIMLTGLSVGVIAGLGPIGYELALRAAVARLQSS